jgi:hypothetical protein
LYKPSFNNTLSKEEEKRGISAADSFMKRHFIDFWDKHDRNISRYSYYDMIDFAEFHAQEILNSKSESVSGEEHGA